MKKLTTKKSRKILLACGLAVLTAAVCLAQFPFGGGGRRGGGRGREQHGPIWRTEGGGRRGSGGFGGGSVEVDEEIVRTAREVESHSTGTPNWTNAPGFEKDVFTFARIIRDRAAGSGGSWITDFPDSDLNLSFRMQQMTALKVNPDGRILRLSSPELYNYPWIYMVETGTLSLRDEEVVALRKYLLNGGVLMADDFWGPVQWQAFENQIKRVLPERQFADLPMSHPIFHSVFDLKGPISTLQTPGERSGRWNAQDMSITWERHDGVECTDMHVRAITDDKGRIMVVAAFNCDNGDGWEREGENHAYFQKFSENRAFPLGINIVFYLMTH